MHGSFNTQAVQEFYSSFEGLSTPMFSEGEYFDFSRTAKSAPKPRVSVKGKASKAEQKLDKAEEVLEMAESLYKQDPSEENYEKVCLAEKLLRISEVHYAEDLHKMQEQLQYSESYDSVDFTRCVRPDGSTYGTRGECRKGTESDNPFESTGGVTTGASGGVIGGSLFGAKGSSITTSIGGDRVKDLISSVKDKNGAYRKLLWPTTKLTKEDKAKLKELKETMKTEAEALAARIHALAEEKTGLLGLKKKDNSKEIEQLRETIYALYEAARDVNKKLKQPMREQTRELKDKAGVIEHSEDNLFNFTRCVRPDGSAYGTAGACRKGVEGKATVYKVRGGDKSPGLLSKLRSRVFNKGGDNKVEVDLYGDEERLLRRKNNALENLKSEGATESEIKETEQHWERLASAAVENRAFADRLTKHLPKGFTPDLDHDGITLTKTTKEGDKVRVAYSPSEGFRFSVNDTMNYGTVRDRRAQLEVAFTVRSAYDAIVRALPEGAIIRTSAWTEDGKGAGRESAYMRMGFSKPDTLGGYMFAVKLSGDRMAPSDAESYEGQSKQKGFMWFTETSEKAEIRNWIEAIFGTPLTIKKEG